MEMDDALPEVGKRTKRTYVTPQLFRVELSQEQTILSACSLSATSAVNGGNRSCRPQGFGSCKNSRNRTGDSGPRSS
jgi:hypothetical protein